MSLSSSQPLRLLTAFFVLLLAVVLQSRLGVFGMYGNVVLAALVAFAFLFDIWELAAFVLLAIFLMNWQPAVSSGLLVFAFLPLAVRGARAIIHPDRWVGSAIAIVASVFLFYLFIAPGMIVNSFVPFLVDVIISLIFGELVIWAMESR